MSHFTRIVYTKTEDIYKDFVKDVQTRFYNSNHALERPLPRQKKMTFFAALRPRTYRIVY